MTALHIEKWITGVSPEDRTSAVARRALESRLAAVRHYLPLAAEEPDEGGEHVHELRVFTRRTTALLKLFADLLPARKARQMRKRVKQIRGAANDARDLDVLTQRWQKPRPDARLSQVLDDIRTRREGAQQLLQATCERVNRDDRFERRSTKLLRRLHPRGNDTYGGKDSRYEDWARSNLRQLLDQFFAASPASAQDVKSLHQFRIRAKELRYAMEVLAGAFPPAFRDQLYPVVETLQDKLGEINDYASGRAHFRRRIKLAEDAEECAHLQKLSRTESARFERARHSFLKWWLPRRRDNLFARFNALLGPDE